LPSEGKGHTFESCRVRHFRTKLRTFSVLNLFACDRGLENIPAADDPYGVVIDGVDNRTDLALAGSGIAAVELLVHRTRECVDLSSINGGCGAALGAGTVECRLGTFPLGRQGSCPFPQDGGVWKLAHRRARTRSTR
jgi:hypothetical protein